MFQGKGVMIGSEDRMNDQRRQSERNFSDLFGTASARPLQLNEAGRSEFHSSATASWMDSTTETSARNLHRRSGEGSLIYDPTAKSVESIALPLSPRSCERSVDVMKEERAFWDVSPPSPRAGMAAGVEVARRHRERIRARSHDSGRTRELTPSERKLANLASGQLRIATGASSEPHDDGRRSSQAIGTRRNMVVDSPRSVRHGTFGEDSPAARSALARAAPNSARQRRMKDMLTSVGFF
ncbi:unnamed protein product [Durusdinium trenchii]|uniref:Uncharacterized protein n=1 Tax=Durusdinium trenchii TaxID=1381693 RepID=A0ABP0NDS7_9DINO